MLGLIAQKIGMSRTFLDDGKEVPVTYLKVTPNAIVRTRTKERDGYDAVVLAAYPSPWTSRKGTKHIKYQTEKEFPVESLEGIEIGTAITAESVPAGSKVTVVGKAKGKGFSGVIKRWNFSRGPETHGSHHHREPGSIGMCDAPGRVLKGKKLPGRLGGQKVTLRGREVVSCDPKENIIAVKGPLPGPNGCTMMLKLESVPEPVATS